MKFLPDEHYSEKIELSAKFAHQSTTGFRTSHWHDENKLNTTLQVDHGATQLMLHRITAKELRALATMLSDTADQIDAHQAQLAGEVVA